MKNLHISLTVWKSVSSESTHLSFSNGVNFKSTLLVLFLSCVLIVVGGANTSENEINSDNPKLVHQDHCPAPGNHKNRSDTIKLTGM